MHKSRFFLQIMFLVFSIFFFFSSTSGNSAQVIINEIGAYEESGYEWIEIFNRGDEAVDVTGWRFWEAGVNHGLALKQGEGILAPGAFALIVQDDQKFLQKYPLVTTTIFDSAWGTLHEDGEEIGLKFGNGENDFVEKFIYLPAPNFSLERKHVHLDDYSEHNWTEHLSENTVGVKNSFTVGEDIPSEESEEGSIDPNHDPVQEEETEEVFDEQNPAPVAIFAVSSSSIYFGNMVSFDATSSTDSDGNIEKYLWNFGDGATGEGVTIHHLYTTTGTFQVELIVDDNDGALASTTESITIMDMPEPEENEFATTSIKIIINEFVSDPSEGKEWIELLNVGSSTVDLGGFTLSDGSGLIASPTSTIDPQGFVVIELNSSKLNNGGDSIFLKNARGEIVDSVIYGDWEDGNLEDNAPAPNKGNSLARINSIDTDNDKADFVQTISVTKGTTNIITAPIAPTPRSSSNRSSSERTTPITEKIPISINTSTGKSFASGTILINELFPNPKGSDTDTEFIELYNTTSSSVSLVGWKLVDKSNKSYSIQEKVIEPFSFAVFLSKVTKISLNNTQEESLTLFDSNGNQIDFVQYSATSTEELSYARQNKNDWEWSTTVTMGKENVFTVVDKKNENIQESQEEESQKESTEIAETNQNLKGIFFSEIFPAPVQSSIKEFVEIGNDGDTVIDLSGFFLDDIDGGSKPYKIPDNTILEPGTYLVFFQDQTKLIFNNTVDTVRLLGKDQSEILVVSYDEAEENQSYIIDENNDFLWTNTITPGDQNVFTENLERNSNKAPKKVLGTKIQGSIDVLLEDIRDLSKGELITVRGTVAVEPGIFGSQYFYIVGEASGVQIYNNKKDFPTINVGDMLEVTGEVTFAYGETRLKTTSKADMVVLGKNGELNAQEVEVIAVDKSLEGALVKVSGEITEVKTNFMYIDDGTSEIKITFKPGSGIKKESLVIGSTVSVEGIVSIGQGSYQILPRSIDDIHSHEEVFSTSTLLVDEEIVSRDIPRKGVDEEDNWIQNITTIVIGVVGVLGILWIKRQVLVDFYQRVVHRKKGG